MVVVRLLVDLPPRKFSEDSIRKLTATATSHGTTSFIVAAQHASLSIVVSSPGHGVQGPQHASSTRSDDNNKHLLPDPENNNNTNPPRWTAFFLSPAVTDSALDDLDVKEYEYCLCNENRTRELSCRLLAMVHPFLAANFAIRGIVSSQCLANNDSPPDIILLDISHAPLELIDSMLQITNGQVIHSGPEAILKSILISNIVFHRTGDGNVKSPLFAAAPAASSVPRLVYDIPTCPVCLHRIEPTRLGLPSPQNHQLCSKFCPPPNLANPKQDDQTLSTSSSSSCPQQRLLRPWPPPCRCNACHVIDRYWKSELQASDKQSHGDNHLRCFRCELEETLWVCLTCGLVGCGRYSNKHSVEHFDETGHPFSLELATLRIWDYATGYFSHRPDLLNCPSSPPLLYPWVHHRRLPHGNIDRSYGGRRDSGIEGMKSPKKASMIGEEYEALLQSALEDQTQHYEGEISRLRSRLAEDSFDKRTMTAHEDDEIRVLQQEIASLRSEIVCCSRELLDWQGKEAGSRAQSQSLLGEQKIVQDLLSTIKEETAKEHAEGNVQVEELEQQIADLTANQNMRRQFSQDEELQQAQIWGMSSDGARGKKGKKARRMFRK